MNGGYERDSLKICTVAILVFVALVLFVTQMDLHERAIQVKDNVLNRSSIIVVPDNRGNITVDVERVQTLIKRGN